MHESERSVEPIAEFDADLSAMGSSDRLSKVLRSLMPAFGFEGLVITNLPVWGTPAHIYLASIPSHWTSFAEAWSLAFDDPGVRAAVADLSPFVAGRLSPRLSAMCDALEVAAGPGRQAFVVPVRKPGSAIGTVSYLASEITLSAEQQTSVRLLSVYAFDRAVAVAQNEMLAEGAALTTRERQCIELVAKGLSDTEIAEKLNISWSTAHYHVERARRKLSARNRAHAVAIAFRARML